MSSRMLLLAVIAAALLATSLPAHVPGIPPEGRGDFPDCDTKGAPNASYAEEQLFIQEASAFSSLEYQMGELALTRSNNVSVQAYARRMIDAHSRLLDDLARQRHVPSGKSFPNPDSLRRLAAVRRWWSQPSRRAASRGWRPMCCRGAERPSSVHRCVRRSVRICRDT